MIDALYIELYTPFPTSIHATVSERHHQLIPHSLPVMMWLPRPQQHMVSQKGAQLEE